MKKSIYHLDDLVSYLGVEVTNILSIRANMEPAHKIKTCLCNFFVKN